MESQGDQAREKPLSDGALLSARDHSLLWFTSGPFCRGAPNFPDQSRIPPKDTKAVILPALKRRRRLA
jgi:hypothetical protein